MVKRTRKPASAWAAIVDAVLTEVGVAAHPSQFSPRPALWVDGREFAHLHDERHLDLRLTRAVIRSERERLADDPGIRRRGGDWIEVDLGANTDLAPILSLVRAALAANRRAGQQPVPDNTALARRRRLHHGSTADLPKRRSQGKTR